MKETRDWAKRTDLHYAAFEGTEQDVRRLLDQGLDVDARDKDQFTPLHFAVMHGKLENARCLLDAGAAVDAQDVRGNTPLGDALFQQKDQEEMVGLLRERGADPYLKNAYGKSPISTAYLIANFDVKRFFSDLPEPEAE